MAARKRDARMNLSRDVNQRARMIMDMATGRLPKPDRDAPATPAELGGAARAAKLSPERRSQIAEAAAAARWGANGTHEDIAND